ncbi:hypothetical protein F0U59_09955 [Archangium gephyra]|nr:hypothetical protein F0U59_09955 [Archangium gephyra]
MKVKSLALPLIFISVGCLHHRGWLQNQDPSIRMPGYDAIMAGAPIDGPTLRALQVATNDFFPSWGPLRACIDTPEAHKYYAVRRGEVIYVAILQNPGYCGRAHSSLDSGVRYAIGADGRILRRLLDGEPALDTLEEDGVEDGGPAPTGLDGGTTAIDVTVPPDARVSFPVVADGGIPSPDGGTPQ